MCRQKNLPQTLTKIFVKIMFILHNLQTIKCILYKYIKNIFTSFDPRVYTWRTFTRQPEKNSVAYHIHTHTTRIFRKGCTRIKLTEHVTYEWRLATHWLGRSVGRPDAAATAPEVTPSRLRAANESGAHAGSRRMCKSDRARKSITEGVGPGVSNLIGVTRQGGISRWRHWRTFKSVMREIYCRRTVRTRSRCEWKNGQVIWIGLRKRYASSLSDVTES